MHEHHRHSHHQGNDEHRHEGEHACDHRNYGHHHGPGHSHAPKDFGRAFMIGILLNSGFVATEALYGLLAHSLALLADAGHNLGDVLGLALAWWASRLAKRTPASRYTYAYGSASILAALANSMLLVLITGGIAWEAILRLWEPQGVQGLTVGVVAAIGVAINLATAMLFMSGRRSDLNVRAAFLHMAGDAAIAFGVAVSGVVMLYTGWTWLDPVVSLIVSVLVVVSAWSVLRHSLVMAMQAVPRGVDLEQVRAYLASIEGVREVHDLHVWAMSTTEIALTVHLVCPQRPLTDALLHQVSAELKHRFNIGHSTLQIESGDSAHPCQLAPSHVV